MTMVIKIRGNKDDNSADENEDDGDGDDRSYEDKQRSKTTAMRKCNGL